MPTPYPQIVPGIPPEDECDWSHPHDFTPREHTLFDRMTHPLAVNRAYMRDHSALGVPYLCQKQGLAFHKRLVCAAFGLHPTLGWRVNLYYVPSGTYGPKTAFHFATMSEWEFVFHPGRHTGTRMTDELYADFSRAYMRMFTGCRLMYERGVWQTSVRTNKMVVKAVGRRDDGGLQLAVNPGAMSDTLARLHEALGWVNEVKDSVDLTIARARYAITGTAPRITSYKKERQVFAKAILEKNPAILAESKVLQKVALAENPPAWPYSPHLLLQNMVIDLSLEEDFFALNWLGKEAK